MPSVSIDARREALEYLIENRRLKKDEYGRIQRAAESLALYLDFEHDFDSNFAQFMKDWSRSIVEFSELNFKELLMDANLKGIISDSSGAKIHLVVELDNDNDPHNPIQRLYCNSAPPSKIMSSGAVTCENCLNAVIYEHHLGCFINDFYFTGESDLSAKQRSLFGKIVQKLKTVIVAHRPSYSQPYSWESIISLVEQVNISFYFSTINIARNFYLLPLACDFQFLLQYNSSSEDDLVNMAKDGIRETVSIKPLIHFIKKKLKHYKIENHQNGILMSKLNKKTGIWEKSPTWWSKALSQNAKP